jgi:hypothetical protein
MHDCSEMLMGILRCISRNQTCLQNLLCPQGGASSAYVRALEEHDLQDMQHLQYIWNDMGIFRIYSTFNIYIYIYIYIHM